MTTHSMCFIEVGDLGRDRLEDDREAAGRLEVDGVLRDLLRALAVRPCAR